MRSKGKRRETLPKLKKKAWRLMSLYVRNRDKFTCVCCGKPGNEAGHLIHVGSGRTHGGHLLDFDFRNINCQCKNCNQYRKEQGAREYTLFMIDKYGRDVIEELKRMKRTAPRVDREYLRGAIDILKFKIKKEFGKEA